VEDPENCSGEQKKSGREKSLSLQQITKGITLKTKVSVGKLPKCSEMTNVSSTRFLNFGSLTDF
jgi:hypothetical protein